MRGVIFLGFLFLAQGFLLFNNGEGGTADYPHYAHTTQIDSSNLWPTIWGKNYSVVNLGSGTDVCPPRETPEVLAGAGKVFFMNYASSLGGCDFKEITDFYNQYNPAIYFVYNFQAAIRAWSSSNPYYPISNQVPLSHVGGQIDLPISILLQPQNFPGGLFGPNASITLDFPTINPIHLGMQQPGGWYQLHWWALTFGLVGMLVSAWKISAFVQLEGVKLNIPQSVLGCCFCSSFFFFLCFGVFGSYIINQNNIVSVDTQDAILYMHYGFTFTALTILGFYFGEIASLTSAQSVPGLSKMKIPAVIFLIILWAVVIAVQALQANDPPFGGAVLARPADVFGFIFAWLGVIVPFFVFLVMIWGSFSLIKAMSGSQNKAPIVRIVLVTAIAVVLYWTLGLTSFVISYYPDRLDWAFHTSLTWQYSVYTLFQGICFIVINVAVSLNFSISVQKEIEVSKSGTSSTSGGSSSGSSSSSSSSSNDPVIEL